MNPPLCCQPLMAFGSVWNNHSCRQSKLLKAKHSSWVSLKFARLIIIHICCKDVQRDLLERGNRWKTKAGENREGHTLMRTYFAKLHLWVLSHFHYCGFLSFLRTVFKVFPNLTLQEAAVNLWWVYLPPVSSTNSMQSLAKHLKGLFNILLTVV